MATYGAGLNAHVTCSDISFHTMKSEQHENWNCSKLKVVKPVSLRDLVSSLN